MAARSSFLFTSESVSEGHPDKVADRISDTVVDAFLAKDPEARVACETLVTTQRIVLAGEVRATQPGNTKEENEAFTQSIIDSLEPLVRAAVKDIGYEQDGFHWETAAVEIPRAVAMRVTAPRWARRASREGSRMGPS